MTELLPPSSKMVRPNRPWTTSAMRLPICEEDGERKKFLSSKKIKQSTQATHLSAASERNQLQARVLDDALANFTSRAQHSDSDTARQVVLFQNLRNDLCASDADQAGA